ncbi:hypothetical protein P4S95_05680 [Aneurinibacillus aneurinilyticus]|uniref:Uncharacterized protein n=1 Tax=Aneurinibacillus aneurinilyticus TaxID=1391 RepID=A0A848D0U1_ANEAE|nr:hypothetical protein [Aneurinibacillus aneurinilyticus]MED0669711.1 hypothetical protein [Aneurinibacillus aneurinilyticus]NMF00812.1 hypothetical protein [Aneurinibacillus aneurinilyticus]
MAKNLNRLSLLLIILSISFYICARLEFSLFGLLDNPYTTYTIFISPILSFILALKGEKGLLRRILLYVSLLYFFGFLISPFAYGFLYGGF